MFKSTVEKVSRLEWFAVLLIPILVVVLVGGGTVYTVNKRLKTALAEQLQATLRANKESLLLWMDGEFGRARNQLRLTAVPLEDSPAQISGRAQALQAIRESLDARAVSLVTLNSQTIASTEARSFTKSFALSERALTRLRNGENALIDVRRPFSDEPPWIGLAVPVGEAHASTHAVLVYYPATGHFSRTLAVARVGETGESYAFGSNGELYSESRFPAHLKTIGLIAPNERSAILSIRLADPGVNLVERGTPAVDKAKWPLTRMAAAATTGVSGLDTDGYRDYRGVPVVGAWEWLDEVGFGIATEIDVDEAFQAANTVQLAFAVMGLLLAAMAGALAWLHAGKREPKGQAPSADSISWDHP